MPLIILTGLPTSGKSTRAKQLHDYLADRIERESSQQQQQPKYRLHLISDQTLSIDRAVYDLSPEKLPAHTRSANASEKDARAALYGAVKRVLSPRDIVILDGLNYIKGWRYQLFCEAKNVRTPSVLLQIGCSVDGARAVNEGRLRRRGAGSAGGAGTQTGEGDGSAPADGGLSKETGADESVEEPYEPENWDNLVFRYEEPNPMTRWDSPLFTLIWEDDEARAKEVFDSMWDAVAGEARKVIRPNQATMQRGKDVGGDYLYVLDRETQDLVKRILEQQGDDGGGEVRIPRSSGGDAGDIVLELPGRKLGLPQLQRHRRAYIGLNRGGIGLENLGNLAVDQIRESFVGYLHDAFANEE